MVGIVVDQVGIVTAAGHVAAVGFAEGGVEDVVVVATVVGGAVVDGVAVVVAVAAADGCDRSEAFRPLERPSYHWLMLFGMLTC